MTLDQEHFARIALDGPVQAVSDHLQLGRLIGRNFPRSGFEVDAVDVDAWHQHPHRRTVTDFIERIATLDPVHRRGLHRFVDQVRRSLRGIDDVATVGNADHGRRQVDIEAAEAARIAIGVVDNDDLAPVAIPPDPAHQLAIAADDVDDLAAVGTDHDGARIRADLLGLNIARAVPESIQFIMTHELLPAWIADDDPAGFCDDGAAAFLRFAACAAEVFEAARAL